MSKLKRSWKEKCPSAKQIYLAEGEEKKRIEKHFTLLTVEKSGEG